MKTVLESTKLSVKVMQTKNGKELDNFEQAYDLKTSSYKGISFNDNESTNAHLLNTRHNICDKILGFIGKRYQVVTSSPILNI